MAVRVSMGLDELGIVIGACVVLGLVLGVLLGWMLGRYGPPTHGKRQAWLND